MRILITGGNGFIGSHLVDTYLEAGYEVGVVDRVKPRQSLNPQVQFFHQDISQAGLEDVFTTFKPDIVNHHAALINVAESFSKPTEYTRTNVLGTIRLLELSKKYAVSQFIFASSVAVYGWVTEFPITEDLPPKPDSFYGIDKYLGEQYIHLYESKFITTIFRYANVYGPRQNTAAEGGVVAIFANNIVKNQSPVINGTGEQTRDFVYVKDVAKASLLATQKHLRGTFQIATNKETSIGDLYTAMADCAKFSLSPSFGPARRGDVDKVRMSYDKAYQALGWKPSYNLSQGLTETLEYFAKLL